MMNTDKQLIYGCMGLGGSWDNSPLTNENQKKADEVLEAVIANGITYFDHADIYSLGKAEKAFGNFLKRHASVREKIFIQSKTGIELFVGPFGSSRYNLSQTYISKQVDVILKRLNVDYLDALLFHRPDPLTSMEELANTVELLKTSGKVRSFGVSNMSTAQIAHLQSFLDEPLIGNQIKLSLAHSMLLDLEIWVNRGEAPQQSGLDGLLSYAAQNNLIVQAYSPLAQGLYAKSEVENDKATKQLLQEMAEKYQSSVSGILLAWLWKISGNIVPIIGTTNVQRIEDSVKAMQVELSREDWYALWIQAKGVKFP